MILENKRILFISPEYFNYSEVIQSGLRFEGAEVELFYNRPASIASKLCLELNRKLYEKAEARYFSSVKKKISGRKYDFILIIRADVIPREFLIHLRNENPNSVFIQYVWDDIDLFPSLPGTFPFFNRVLSYDIHDSKKFGLPFRPFFFVSSNENSKKNQTKVHDLFFIGAYHTDRINVLEKIKRLNPELDFHIHFYINPLTFLLNRLPFSKLGLFRFRKMEYPEMIEEINKSTSVLDIQKVDQHGLTTRIFEALGAGAKVITTNANIRLYEFFNDLNFHVIDRDNPVINQLWIKSPAADYDTSLLMKYHISSWIKDVFDIQDNNTNQLKH
jgi:hypothetical protein